jgi:hypothetical protein
LVLYKAEEVTKFSDTEDVGLKIDTGWLNGLLKFIEMP